MHLRDFISWKSGQTQNCIDIRHATSTEQPCLGAMLFSCRQVSLHTSLSRLEVLASSAANTTGRALHLHPTCKEQREIKPPRFNGLMIPCDTHIILYTAPVSGSPQHRKITTDCKQKAAGASTKWP